MRDLAAERGVDLAFVANQYSIWRSGAPTTVVGTGRVQNLESAVAAAQQPPDPELEEAFLALLLPQDARQWMSGLPREQLTDRERPGPRVFRLHPAESCHAASGWLTCCPKIVT